jgi:hypothetical protein
MRVARGEHGEGQPGESGECGDEPKPAWLRRSPWPRRLARIRHLEIQSLTACFSTPKCPIVKAFQQFRRDRARTLRASRRRFIEVGMKDSGG